jgi:FIP domain
LQDLIQTIVEQRKALLQKDSYIADLEGYIDNLILKVIDMQPKILLHGIETTSDNTVISQITTASNSQPVSTATVTLQGFGSSGAKSKSKEKATVSFNKLGKSPSKSDDKKSSPFRAIQTVLK